MFVFRKIWRALFFLKHPFWDYPFCLITDELLLMNSLFLKIFAKCVLSTATFTFFGFIICWIKLSLHISFVLLGEESNVLFDSEVIEIDHFFYQVTKWVPVFCIRTSLFIPDGSSFEILVEFFWIDWVESWIKSWMKCQIDFLG